ncbi:MAG: DinB family protein [Candidatus Pseudobacter hemicellulosilyticus]|uniref:DinB family protein n=1 Tax=Candidatus Pseudobacter hemicellulosilyticus TaxID=3121375 RepID=A0AAJ5WYQ5_9BACT|nr:MAG: DinB family protein [Pseudobacter sp.]
MTNTQTITEATPAIITAKEWLEHWQGHRRLTRRTIEAFPEDKLFSFSIGGMRPFSELVWEIISIAEFGVDGIVSNEWQSLGGQEHNTGEAKPTTRKQLLAKWDAVTEKLNTWFPRIQPERYQEMILAFNAYEGTVTSTILYYIENEIHHRGQGYVYLRALGIEPPPFYER